MMSPANVLEPTYGQLRRWLLAGTWLPGTRLEAGRIAEELGVSITPVRDALNRLTGERLIHSITGQGFHVPDLDEREFGALIGWHELIVTTALRGTRAIVPTIGSVDVPPTPAERTSILFTEIVRPAGNPELDWACLNAGDRLTPYRHREIAVLPDANEEISELERTRLTKERNGLLALIKRYHRRRRLLTSQLVHAARHDHSL